jgi:hypothetical protein
LVLSEHAVILDRVAKASDLFHQVVGAGEA